ncbi:MAG TPA: MFS transporter, partial [Vicinamibacterales bacterium]|nr:MFS transporter [Vicinamibacterales bacterium]
SMPVRDPGGTLGAVAAGVLSWRRNLAALTAASFIGFTGFTLVMPFLPLYIAELGVRDVGRIALWTGMTLGVTPALTALLAPAWGRLADRFGRKLMVARSLASFVVIMAAMAWVTSPWHLFALRAVQGLFAGYGALCLAMAADSSPRDRIAQSIGMVQTAQRLGPALGPVLGGLVAGAVGLRAAFLVTSVFYLVALVQLLVLYHEPGEHHASAAAAPSRVTFANVLAFENFLLLMAAIFGLQFVDRSFGPVLPLHVASLGVRPSHVAVVSGVVFSTLACSAAVGHHVCARLLRRWSARVVISRAALVAAFAVALFLVVGNAWALVPTAAVFGGCIGAAMTAAYAAAAGVVPATVRGASFGFLSSASLAGLALSPAICGFLAATDIRIVFAADALALCVLAMLVRRVMVEHPRVTETPVVADA